MLVAAMQASAMAEATPSFYLFIVFVCVAALVLLVAIVVVVAPVLLPVL